MLEELHGAVYLANTFEHHSYLWQHLLLSQLVRFSGAFSSVNPDQAILITGTAETKGLTVRY